MLPAGVQPDRASIEKLVSEGEGTRSFDEAVEHTFVLDEKGQLHVAQGAFSLRFVPRTDAVFEASLDGVGFLGEWGRERR